MTRRTKPSRGVPGGSFDPVVRVYAKYGMMTRMPAPPLKPVVWLGDSLRELKAFPAAVQDEMGYAIYLAQ